MIIAKECNGISFNGEFLSRPYDTVVGDFVPKTRLLNKQMCEEVVGELNKGVSFTEAYSKFRKKYANFPRRSSVLFT